MIKAQDCNTGKITLKIEQEQENWFSVSDLLVKLKEKCKYPKGCFGLALHFTAIMFLDTLWTTGPTASVNKLQTS